MNLDQLIAFCESLPGSIAIIKIENHLTYNIGGKSFIWFGQEELPITCSFKCSDEDFVLLSEREGFMPAPYMARNKWIMCKDIAFLNKEDLNLYVRKSYDLIMGKLPKTVQKAIFGSNG